MISGDLPWVFTLFDKAAFDTVVNIGQFNPAVADGATAVLGKYPRQLPHLRSHSDTLTFQEAHIAIDIADDLYIRGDSCVTLDQKAD